MPERGSKRIWREVLSLRKQTGLLHITKVETSRHEERQNPSSLIQQGCAIRARGANPSEAYPSHTECRALETRLIGLKQGKIAPFFCDPFPPLSLQKSPGWNQCPVANHGWRKCKGAPWGARRLKPRGRDLLPAVVGAPVDGTVAPQGSAPAPWGTAGTAHPFSPCGLRTTSPRIPTPIHPAAGVPGGGGVHAGSAKGHRTVACLGAGATMRLAPWLLQGAS